MDGMVLIFNLKDKKYLKGGRFRPKRHRKGDFSLVLKAKGEKILRNIGLKYALISHYSFQIFLPNIWYKLPCCFNFFPRSLKTNFIDTKTANH